MRSVVPMLLLVATCTRATAKAPGGDGAPAEEQCLVPCGDVRFGARVADQIPPLDGPPVVTARDATYLAPDDAVVGVALAGEARAYPLKVLALHQVVNDVLGGRAVTVVFSPLAGAAVAIDAEATGTPEGFGTTGGIYESDSIVYDRETGSWWSPMMLRAIRGPRMGDHLRVVRHVRSTWAAWLAIEPATTVLSDRTGVPEFDYSAYAYAWYEADDAHLMSPMRRLDLRLPKKEAVVGVVADEIARAYASSRLPMRGAIADSVGERPVLIVRDALADLIAAYDRTVGDLVLDFAVQFEGDRLLLRDAQTGSLWNAFGEAISGPLAGSTLVPAAPYRAYWFAWAAFHPASEIFGSPAVPGQTEKQGGET